MSVCGRGSIDSFFLRLDNFYINCAPHFNNFWVRFRKSERQNKRITHKQWNGHGFVWKKKRTKMCFFLLLYLVLIFELCILFGLETGIYMCVCKCELQCNRLSTEICDKKICCFCFCFFFFSFSWKGVFLFWNEWKKKFYPKMFCSEFVFSRKFAKEK